MRSHPVGPATIGNDRLDVPSFASLISARSAPAPASPSTGATRPLADRPPRAHPSTPSTLDRETCCPHEARGHRHRARRPLQPPVRRGTVDLESVGALNEGDAVRLTGVGGHTVTAVDD